MMRRNNFYSNTDGQAFLGLKYYIIQFCVFSFQLFDLYYNSTGTENEKQI